MSNKKQSKQEKNMASLVMDSINENEVKMHSKWYFAIVSAISAMSVFLTSLFAAIFVNLAIRDVDYAESNGLREFGPEAQSQFISAFPWLLAALFIVALASTWLLASKLEFAYKFRKYSLFGGVMGLVIALGLFTSLAGINDRIESSGPFRDLQTLREISDRKIIQGSIKEIGDGSLTIETTEGSEVKVEYDEETPIRGDFDLVVGEKIGVFGEKDGDDSWDAEILLGKPMKWKGSNPGKNLPRR